MSALNGSRTTAWRAFMSFLFEIVERLLVESLLVQCALSAQVAEGPFALDLRAVFGKSTAVLDVVTRASRTVVCLDPVHESVFIVIVPFEYRVQPGLLAWTKRIRLFDESRNN